MKLANYVRDAFVASALNDVPAIDYTEQIRSIAMKAAIAALPPKVRAAYSDEACRPFVETVWVNLASISLTLPGFEREVVRAAIQPSTSALLEKHFEQQKKLDDLRSKLRQIVRGCTTRKALAEALPEFEKYLPADEAGTIRSLPAVANVVSDFVKAGWPKPTAATKTAAAKAVRATFVAASVSSTLGQQHK